MNRPRLALVVVLCCLTAVGPGCGLGGWGVQDTEPRFEPTTEYWEAPVGALVFPVGLALDLTITATTTIVLGFLNPINWVAFVLNVDPFFPIFYVFTGTSTGVTLMNPSCNLDWTRPAPYYSYGIMFRGQDDDDRPDPRLDPDRPRTRTRDDPRNRRPRPR